MKKFLIICIAFVACWARPDVSHITNNQYLPPLQTLPKHYSSTSEGASRTTIKHSQIESIQPSIHIASFSLRTIVPLQQYYKQIQRSQSIQTHPHQTYYSPRVRQSSSAPTETFFNYNAPSINHQNTVHQSYAGRIQSSLPMPASSKQTVQQYYAPQTQQLVERTYMPLAPVQRNYEAPTTYQHPQVPAQQYYTQTMSAQPTHSPPASLHQTYLPPAPLQQNEHQPLVQRTYLPPVPFHQTETQSPAQTTYSARAPTYMSSSAPSQQSYSAVEQPTYTTAEPLQQRFFPPIPVPANVQPAQLQALVQQNNSAPSSEYQSPAQVQQSYVSQQSIPQPVQPSYVNANFDSSRAYELPLVQHQTSPMQPIYPPLASTPTSFSNQQFYSPLLHNQQDYRPHGSPQQSYSQSAQTSSEANKQQSYYSAPTYLPPTPIQLPRIIEQFQSPPQTTNEEPQFKQSAIQQPTSPAVPRYDEGLYNNLTVEPYKHQYSELKTTQPNLDVYIGPSKDVSTPKDPYSPTSVQQVASSTSGSYTDKGPVDLKETNVAPAPQQKPPKASIENSGNNELPSRTHFNQAATSSASGLESHIPRHSSQNPAEHNYSPSRATSDIATFNYIAPTTQSIQKAVQTTEFNTFSESSNQQATEPNSPAVSSYNYQTTTNIAPASVQMFNFVPEPSVQSQNEFNSKDQESQQTLKGTEAQPINALTNHETSESKMSTNLIALEPAQKTESSIYPNAGTEYSSGGGYIYRRD